MFCPLAMRYSAYFFKKVVFPAPKKPVIKSIFTNVPVSSLLPCFYVIYVLLFYSYVFHVIYCTFSYKSMQIFTFNTGYAPFPQNIERL